VFGLIDFVSTCAEKDDINLGMIKDRRFMPTFLVDGGVSIFSARVFFADTAVMVL
jgi:hypothetical protein